MEPRRWRESDRVTQIGLAYNFNGVMGLGELGKQCETKPIAVDVVAPGALRDGFAIRSQFGSGQCSGVGEGFCETKPNLLLVRRRRCVGSAVRNEANVRRASWLLGALRGGFCDTKPIWASGLAASRSYVVRLPWNPASYRRSG